MIIDVVYALLVRWKLAQINLFSPVGAPEGHVATQPALGKLVAATARPFIHAIPPKGQEADVSLLFVVQVCM